MFHDPFFLEHMEQAVDCIEQALAEKKAYHGVMGIMIATAYASCAVLAPMLAQAGQRLTSSSRIENRMAMG